MREVKTYSNLIGGKWLQSSSGKTFSSVNPADTTDVLGYFQQTTLEETRQAIEATRAAQPSWAQTSPARRAEILDRTARLIDERVTYLAEILTREEGKTLAESTAEVKRAAANFRFYAGQAYLVAGETLPSDEPSTFLYTLKAPVGLVSVITPWNFPLAIPARKIAPALAAGNSVIFKPASLTPLIGLKLAEILIEAGLPGDVMISALKNLGSMTGVAVTSLVSTVTQLTVLAQLATSGTTRELAERQSFASAVNVTFLLSAGVCLLVVFMSLVRGRSTNGTTKAAQA